MQDFSTSTDTDGVERKGETNGAVQFDAITKAIAKWIAMNGRPSNIVTVSSAAAEALAHYRAEPEIDKASCPLEWWRKCAASHGLIAKLAFKHLASPASTVPCERLFSLSGHVVNSKCASMSPDNINRLVCLNNWLNMD